MRLGRIWLNREDGEEEREGTWEEGKRFVAVKVWTIASGLTEVTLDVRTRGKQMLVDLRGYAFEDNGPGARERGRVAPREER